MRRRRASEASPSSDSQARQLSNITRMYGPIALRVEQILEREAVSVLCIIEVVKPVSTEARI